MVASGQLEVPKRSFELKFEVRDIELNKSFLVRKMLTYQRTHVPPKKLTDFRPETESTQLLVIFNADQHSWSPIIQFITTYANSYRNSLFPPQTKSQLIKFLLKLNYRKTFCFDDIFHGAGMILALKLASFDLGKLTWSDASLALFFLHPQVWGCL